VTAAAKIRRWQQYRNAAGTMLGYLSAEMPSGMIINDLKLMRGPEGKFWIAMPAVKQVGKDSKPRLDASGKAVWTQFVEFSNSVARQQFSNLILDALRERHPEAFEDAGA
jgi:hypothetical protein